jgi:phage shock protein E
MDSQWLAQNGVWLLVGAFVAWRFVSPLLARRKIPQWLKEGAVVVDVRSSGEFAGGARPGSVNIPLDQLAKRSSELDKSKPVILCCASGTRSAMAAGVLRKQGFGRVMNAGPWTNTLQA